MNKVIKLWDKAKLIVLNITKILAFPIERLDLAKGRDTT